MADYHHGELAVQDRAGLAAAAEHARPAIRATMPEVAKTFLAAQPVLYLGASDGDRLWGTMLTGPPGFVQATGDGTVRIAARPTPADPLAAALDGVAEVGMIAVEPGRRRRMRVNGRSRPVGDHLEIEVEQVISNCPKYIQQRTPLPAEGPAVRPSAGRGGELGAAQIDWIRAADTFFVATAGLDGAADMSHRGGNPGFVEVTGPARLSWPDYLGNAMFLTLGNLEEQPATGLLFPGYTTGSTLHLSGTARVDWSPDRAARYPGAQRVVDFTVTDVVEIQGAATWRWTAPAYSRFNPVIA
ncbi:pyridoxamine 5'-phosphate oxidase family protein [Amycolatopsis magusensis]|uniref:pyridoxamine 5'-phosphate oxidase family protein n=1 Tax=Amycolatopsis magusensis TaxID=882444 RepID=UPI003C2C3FC9